LTWLSFYASVVLFALTRRLPAQVVLLTTPPFLHAVFRVCNWFALRKARIILWNQDTYPEILAAVGLMKKSSWRYRSLTRLERWGLKRVDQVVVLDGAMARILVGQGAPAVRVIPNWEVATEKTVAFGGDLDKVLAQARRHYRYIILYTGNYGWGHDLSIVLDYLSANGHQRELFFLFVGGGEKWDELVSLRRIHDIECMDVFGYVPREQVGAIIERADFGLVALERSCVGLMSPSKIHGYLALGKPLLYIGPEGSNVAEAIDAYGCGWRVDEKDTVGLTSWLDRIRSPEFDQSGYADSARHAFACRYSEEVAIAEFVELLGAPGKR
jgi:glycosyltransferase involved in cell wall biosynthesis